MPKTRYLLPAAIAFAAVFCLRLSHVAAGDAALKVLAPDEVAAAGMDPSELAKIGDKMRQFVDDQQISGVVTLAARRGQIVHWEAVGNADIADSRPMSKDSLFAIASMTKPVTATAVMILQDEGKLSVDDPVAQYIPAFKTVSLDGRPPKRDVTIRDMLTHTSGIGGSQQNQGSLKETVELLVKQPMQFEPGSKWQYSPGLSVCGRVVEVVSGQAFDEFLAERIFQPLKMNDTTFNPSAEQRKRVVRLYKPSADKKSLEVASHWLNDLSEPRTPNPSGGLFSTAGDMVRFYQMVLNGGELDGRRIVSKAAVQQMTSVQTGELTTGFTPGNGWGLGWCVVREPQGVSSMVSPGTFGHGGAFGTQGWIDPQRQMIFVLMIQRTEFGNSDASDIRGEFQKQAVSAIKH